MSKPRAATGKRKRSSNDDKDGIQKTGTTTIQIVAGSYERVLHGLSVSIPNDQLEASSKNSETSVSFSDTFLFHAHASSIRCLALSPPSPATPRNPPKRLLATGGTDERINLFSISAAAPPTSKRSRTKFFPELSGQANNNRELGALTHHTATVSALHFPSRSKLLSTSYDNTIAVTRVRDWSLLSTIRAPLPKSANRPSGDTAGPGELPAGISAVAVHPSAKLCLSVGQGERCMRLWNLVTGKKAGVLMFDKSSLTLLGEGRWRGGEGRNVAWSEDGEEFAIGFERGALVFGQDCQIKGVAPVVGAKICQLKYVRHEASFTNFLVLSTEDGRLLFFDSSSKDESSEKLLLKVVGQVGSSLRGNRIKDFEILRFNSDIVLLVTANSDGEVALWKVDLRDLHASQNNDADHVTSNGVGKDSSIADHGKTSHIVGELQGTCQTNQRITCIAAFIMEGTAQDPRSHDKANGTEEEWAGFDSGEAGEDQDESSGDSDEE